MQCEIGFFPLKPLHTLNISELEIGTMTLPDVSRHHEEASKCKPSPAALCRRMPRPWAFIAPTPRIGLNLREVGMFCQINFSQSLANFMNLSAWQITCRYFCRLYFFKDGITKSILLLCFISLAASSFNHFQTFRVSVWGLPNPYPYHSTFVHVGYMSRWIGNSASGGFSGFHFPIVPHALGDSASTHPATRWWTWQM